MKGKELIRGITGNKGTAVGYVRIVNDIRKLTDFKTGNILVCNEFEYDEKGLFARYLENAAAMVQNLGGVVHSGAVQAIERKKPCIVGTKAFSGKMATEALKEGNMVVVEGLTGYEDAVDKNGKPYKRPYGTVYQYIQD